MDESEGVETGNACETMAKSLDFVRNWDYLLYLPVTARKRILFTIKQTAMKRFIIFTALTAFALTSLTSCAEMLDAMMNNYSVDNATELIGETTMEKSQLGEGDKKRDWIIFTFNSKNENSKDKFELLMLESVFKAAQVDSVDVYNVAILATANNGTSDITWNKELCAFGSKDPNAGKWDVSFPEYYGRLKITDLGGGSYKIRLIHKFTLTELVPANSDKTPEKKTFKLNLTYHGNPTVINK